MPGSVILFLLTMSATNKYCFLVLLLCFNISFSQSFTTRVSATIIGKMDVLQIEYVAENASLEEFVLPSFPHWTIVSGPNLSSSRMQNGNVVKMQTIYSVMVQPEITGTITVPGASARINNKVQNSNSIQVVVKNTDHVLSAKPPTQPATPSILDQFPFADEVPANQYLKKGEKAIDKIKNNILVRLEVDKKTSYVGEPILAVYKLCTRLRSKSKVVKQPSFTGCTVIELTGDDQDQHVEKINGTDYNVFTIRRVQLLPLEAGPLVLPATSVENKVTFYDASKIDYRDLYYNQPSLPAQEQLVTLQNKPATVMVKPLPPYPAVGSGEFSGAIGKYEVTASTGDEKLTTTSTNHLLFYIQGEGNLQNAKPPVIKWPKGIEAFEPTVEDDDDKADFPVKSHRLISIPFVTAEPGTYTIPAIDFTYFDAATEKYITRSTAPLVLHVSQGKKTFFNTIVKNDAGSFQKRLYILLGAGLLAVIIGLVWRSGKTPPVSQPVTLPPAKEQPQIERRTAGEFLFNIRELQPGVDSSNFYKMLCKNLQLYVEHKFSRSVSDLPAIAESHPLQAAHLHHLKILLDDCNVGMYTPVFTIEEAMQHRLKAIEILCNLEETHD